MKATRFFCEACPKNAGDVGLTLVGCKHNGEFTKMLPVDFRGIIEDCPIKNPQEAAELVAPMMD